MSTNPYTQKIQDVIRYKNKIVTKRDSLTSLINTLKSNIDSSILSANSMPNDYYKKFTTKEATDLTAAKSRRDYVTNTVLTTIDSRLASLRTMESNWQDPVT